MKTLNAVSMTIGGAAKKPAVVYVNDRGKSAGWGSEGDIQPLIERGFIVFADLRGWGETRATQNPDEDTETYRLFGDYPNSMRALLVGRTLVGMRAEDIFRGVDSLASRPEVDQQKIYGYGLGPGALTLLHEAVLDKRISELALDRMPVSYHSVVAHRIHHDMYESVIPGLLKAYDLPDLVAAVAPRPVWLVDIVDPLRKVLPAEQTRGQYASSFEAFRVLGADAAIRVLTEKPEQRVKVFE